MIKRGYFYLAGCDGCHQRLSEDYWDILCKDRIEIMDELEEHDWIKEGRKTFCPLCQEPTQPEEKKDKDCPDAIEAVEDELIRREKKWVPKEEEGDEDKL